MGASESGGMGALGSCSARANGIVSNTGEVVGASEDDSG